MCLLSGLLTLLQQESSCINEQLYTPVAAVGGARLACAVWFRSRIFKEGAWYVDCFAKPCVSTKRGQLEPVLIGQQLTTAVQLPVREHQRSL